MKLRKRRSPAGPRSGGLHGPVSSSPARRGLHRFRRRGHRSSVRCARPAGGVLLQVRQQSVRHAPHERTGARDGRRHQGGNERPRGDQHLSVKSAWVRHGHPEPDPFGRRRVLHLVRPDPVDVRARRFDQRDRLRFPGLRGGLDRDGRGVGRLCAPSDRRGRSRADGDDLGQRVPSDDDLDEADQYAGRFPRPEAARAPSPLWTSMFKALEAAPASINFNEVYSALQTRVVDGQENPLAIISTAKLNEVQKYCSLTNHMWDGFWFLANRRAWERLPENLRDIVAKHINAAGLKEREDVAKLNATLQQELAGKGMTFNQTDPARFRDKLRQAGFYAEWKAKYGDEAWAILERSTGKLS